MILASSSRISSRLRVFAVNLLLLVLIPAVQAEGQLRILNTKHYKIHTDIDQPVAEDLGRRMDGMFDEYSKRLADFAPAHEGRLSVYLFNKRDDYLKFTASKFPNTGGVFMPARGLVAAFLEGQGRTALRRTLQHEAFHQFADAAIGANIPIWLNEGIAQVFEEGLWTGDGFMLGQVPPRRIRQLKADMDGKRLTPFKELLALTPQQWQAKMDDPAAGATYYNQAWAMTHFLIFAEDDKGQFRFRARLVAMLRELKAGTAGDAAFTKTFSDNLAGFQERFVEYARELSPSAESTMIERQEVLADMMIELARAGKTFATIDAFRQAVIEGRLRLQYTRAQIKWSTQDDPDVYFQDADGKPLRVDRLSLEPASNAPLPSIVCQATDKLKLTTRFYRNGDGKIERDVVVKRP